MLAFLLAIEDPQKRKFAAKIYRKYEERLRQWIAYILKAKFETDNLSLVEDITERTFIKVVKYIDKLYGTVDEKHTKRYLYRIALNETANCVREEKPVDNFDDYEDFLGEEDALFTAIEDNDDYERIIKVIMTLDDKYSTVLGLYYSNDMSISDVAETLGIPEKTVYTRLSRGIKQVKQKLGIGE